MSKVNFISEFNLFMRYARNNNLSLRERMLWIALFYIANDRATYNEQTQEYDWPDGFKMDLSELLRATYAMFLPPKAQTVSEWADENRVLVSESSAEPGPWRTDRAPYQREIMDAFTQPGIYEIVIMASSQVGKSEIELNMMGRAIDNDPGPMLYVQPTDKVAEDYSKRRIAPMIAACPTLRDKVYKAKGRDAANTITMKTFPGGSLAIIGANSPSDLASNPSIFVKFPKMKSKDLDSSLPDHTHPAFIVNGVEQDYILLGKYKAASLTGSGSDGGTLYSLPNMPPAHTRTADAFLTQLRAFGGGVSGMTVADRGFLLLLAQKNGWNPGGNSDWGHCYKDPPFFSEEIWQRIFPISAQRAKKSRT